MGLAVLAQALDHTDLALLDDVDHVLEHDEEHDDDERGDDEAGDGQRTDGDHGSSLNSAARTVSVVPLTPMTITGVVGGIGSSSQLTASQLSPSRRT